MDNRRAGLSWRDQLRSAKKRHGPIQFTRGRPKRVQLYRELIRITEATLAYLAEAARRLHEAADLAVVLCSPGSATIGR